MSSKLKGVGRRLFSPLARAMFVAMACSLFVPAVVLAACEAVLSVCKSIMRWWFCLAVKRARRELEKRRTAPGQTEAMRAAIPRALVELDSYLRSNGADRGALARAADTLEQALHPTPTQENPDAAH